jgi:hypothetical protein
MAGATNLARMVPGFDFLQGLLSNASAGLPHMGQWIAPTLDPDELGKRIGELRTVQFWLEQNARLLGTTIQALEVQKMTLTTLKTMNLPLADLTEALKIRMPAAPAVPAAPEPPPAAPPPGSEPPAGQAGAASAAGVVDPLQWWGALTQQFTELATKAVQESATAGAKVLAGGIGTPLGDAAGAAAEPAAAAAAPAPGRAAAPRKRAR